LLGRLRCSLGEHHKRPADESRRGLVAHVMSMARCRSLPTERGGETQCVVERATIFRLIPVETGRTIIGRGSSCSSWAGPW
jgi:hypothetical protein